MDYCGVTHIIRLRNSEHNFKNGVLHMITAIKHLVIWSTGPIDHLVPTQVTYLVKK